MFGGERGAVLLPNKKPITTNAFRTVTHGNSQVAICIFENNDSKIRKNERLYSSQTFMF